MGYDHFQWNWSIVTYDTDLNLKDFDSKNVVKPNMSFKLV